MKVFKKMKINHIIKTIQYLQEKGQVSHGDT
jgi:hypothetical protein